MAIWGWGFSTLFVLFQFTFQLSSGTLLHAMMDDFKVSATMASLLISSFYYCYVLFQVPAGMLFDRFGPRFILSIGAMFAGIGCMIFASSHYYLFAMIGRIFFGAGASFAFVGMLYMTRLSFAKRYYTMMAGLVDTFGLITSVIGTVSIAHCLHVYGWRGCFWLGAFFSCLLAAGCYAYVPNTEQQLPKSNSRLSHDLALLIKNPTVWLNGLYIGILFSVLTVFASLWSTPFLMLKLQLNLPQASTLSACCILGAAIGCPLFGYIAELINRQILMLLSCISTCLLLFIILFSTSQVFWLYALLMCSLGFCCASYMVSFSICEQIAPPALRNSLAGLTNGLAMITAPLLQPLIGYLLDWYGDHHSLASYQKALLILPIAIAINAFIVLCLPNQTKAMHTVSAE